MKTIKHLNKWANGHSQYYYFDFARWILGAFLFYKGVEFMIHRDYLAQIISTNQWEFWGGIAVHYVAFAHLCGGLFIVLGLLTRVAAGLQLPILLGAVYFNLATTNGTELWLAIIALMGSLLFLIIGSGKHSVDYSLKLQV